MNKNFYEKFSLPNWYANLALSEFKNLSDQLNHRRKIAKIYAGNLDKKILQSRITNKITLSSNLRFPIFVENRNSLIKYLKSFKIFVSDIWYDDVDKSLPNSQTVAHTILNLPTHRNVSENDARKIAQEINQWLKSQ